MPKIQEFINDLSFVVADYLHQTVADITDKKRDEMIVASANDDCTDLEKEVGRHVKDESNRRNQLLYIINTIRAIRTQWASQQFIELKNTINGFLTTVMALHQGNTAVVQLGNTTVTLESLQRAFFPLLWAKLDALLTERVLNKHRSVDLCEIIDDQAAIAQERSDLLVVVRTVEERNAELAAKNDKIAALMQINDECTLALNAKDAKIAKLTEDLATVKSAMKSAGGALVQNSQKLSSVEQDVTQLKTTIRQLELDCQKQQAELTAAFLADQKLRHDLKTAQEMLNLYSLHFAALEKTKETSLMHSNEVRNQIREHTTRIITSFESMRKNVTPAAFFLHPTDNNLKTQVNQIIDQVLKSSDPKLSKSTLRQLIGINPELAGDLFKTKPTEAITLLDYLTQLFAICYNRKIPDWVHKKHHSALELYATQDHQNSEVDNQYRLFKQIKDRQTQTHSSSNSASSLPAPD